MLVDGCGDSCMNEQRQKTQNKQHLHFFFKIVFEENIEQDFEELTLCGGCVTQYQ